MVGAGDPALFYSAVEQGGASVRTVVLDQADPAAAVLEQHQVFAQQPNETCRPLVCEILRKRDRVPVTAEEIASRRPRADPGQ
jgi:hypothetical protein